MKNLRSGLKFRERKCLNYEHRLDIYRNSTHTEDIFAALKNLPLNDFANEFFAGFSLLIPMQGELFANLIFHDKFTMIYKTVKQMRYANPFRLYLKS